MNSAIVIALVGLIVVIVVHIVVIARWSGQIDGYIRAASDNFARIDGEIDLLRKGRHEADGKIMQHSGLIRSLEVASRVWDRRGSLGDA